MTKENIDLMDDGIIDLDSERAKLLGFTSDLFQGYLWKVDKNIYISFIVSNKPGNGNLGKLFANIEQRGYIVAVPTPLGRMETILKHKGFTPAYEEDAEVWTKEKK